MPKDIVDIKAALRLKGFSFRISSRVKGIKAGIHKSQHKGISPDPMVMNSNILTGDYTVDTTVFMLKSLRTK